MLSAIPISNVWSLIQCEEGWKLIEAWHTLIVPTIYISGHEILSLKNPHIEKNMILKAVMII